MNTGWKTTEMTRTEGRLTMYVNKWYAGGWSANLYVTYAWQTAGHSLVLRPGSDERFETSMDAIDAAECYVARLGPVEPVMALITAFSRAQGYQRRARREAA